MSGETEAKFYAALLTAGLPEGTEAAVQEAMELIHPASREQLMKWHLANWSKKK